MGAKGVVQNQDGDTQKGAENDTQDCLGYKNIDD